MFTIIHHTSPNGPDGPPNGPDGGAGDRRVDQPRDNVTTYICELGTRPHINALAACID